MFDRPHLDAAHPIPVIAGFESTWLPQHGVDVCDLTGHTRRWRGDVDAALAAGCRMFRYPVRWQVVEAEQGQFDWREPDETLGHLRDHGAEVIVDLLHHTSYPAWLTDGFRDRRFHAAYVTFAAAVARRYEWLPAYTLFNEPFATLFLAGHEALWPPYDQGMAGFTRLLRNVLPAVSEASACWSDLLPNARHVWVDTCEHHAGTAGGPARYAALANDRRHLVLDLALGLVSKGETPGTTARVGTPHEAGERPVVRALLDAGGEPLLGLGPVRVDVLGLDYYPHSEWWYDDRQGYSPSPCPRGFAAVAADYGRRYGLPMALTETNVRGLPTDRATWLRYMTQQYELALAAGVDLRGFCWFPFVDSTDWDSLLARPAGRPDPVGVLSLGAGQERRRTAFTQAWTALVRGCASDELPAYRLQPPCAGQLEPVVAPLAGWPWRDPVAAQLSLPTSVPTVPSAISSAPRTDPRADHREQGTAMTTSSSASTTATERPAVRDLVVLSHLRWPWVWQRPQHLVSRFAAARAESGARTWFVEEPLLADVTDPVLRTHDASGVTRAWLEVPRGGRSVEKHVGFDAPEAASYGRLLTAVLRRHGVVTPDVLLYTPLALDIAVDLSPETLSYDVMDDLAAFHDAPQGLTLRHRRALVEADVVFAGGRSLHREASRHRDGTVHLFPSGVETAHYAQARSLRPRKDRPVAGYVGVIDERLDLDLVAALAAALPGWDLQIVGPVAKIPTASLPEAANLHYPGMAPYASLPVVMAGFDVALMPFARNEATRSISPTKTLEYLAAGLPVVSTRVPDVVADFGDIVALADDATSFARACQDALTRTAAEKDRLDRLARRAARRHEWDAIAHEMGRLMAEPSAWTERDGAEAERA